MFFSVLQVSAFALLAQVELIPNQDYSIRRFAEVVEDAVEAEELTPQEKLIALRAKLVIAERELDEMEQKRELASTPQQREEAPKVVHLRAAKAKVDHYKISIKQMEKMVLNQKKTPKKSR